MDRLSPLVAIGPVIILIGLSLSEVVIDMVKTNWPTAFTSLGMTVTVPPTSRGLVKLVPIICGVVVGYSVTALMGIVNFSGVEAAPWSVLPSALARPQLPRFAWESSSYMIPAVIAPVIEHVGDVYVIGVVAERDFTESPDSYRTMLGDGLACLAARFFGGPPVIIYNGVTGAMSITKVTHPRVIRIVAIVAIVFSVVGKLSTLSQSIPFATLGGIILLLSGTAASVNVQDLTQHKADLNHIRNITIISITPTMGTGGAVL